MKTDIKLQIVKIFLMVLFLVLFGFMAWRAFYFMDRTEDMMHFYEMRMGLIY